jgi:23S rRNA pseudouridine1911/1915/1917 synthase
MREDVVRRRSATAKDYNEAGTGSAVRGAPRDVAGYAGSVDAPLSPPRRSFSADRGDDRERLDRVLVRRLGDLGVSRVEAARWVRDGKVAVAGAPVLRPAQRVFVGDAVTVELPPPPPGAPALVAQELPLRVLWEDGHLLALDKPAGLVVHPTWGHRDGTLFNGLLWHARRWAEDGLRPRLAHRLDKDTSGVLLVTKTRAAHAGVARAFQRREVRKEYLAIVHGRPAVPHGRVELSIARDASDPKRRIAGASDGLPARTAWQLVADGSVQGEPVSLVRCRPETGRTHQIRVHLAAVGLPIAGDPLYGDGVLALPRQALHAARLELVHPIAGETLVLESPLPDDLRALLVLAGIG